MNSPPKGITAPLYGGDSEMRIQQEIVLGVRGVRALSAMGISPAVCHMKRDTQPCSTRTTRSDGRKAPRRRSPPPVTAEPIHTHTAVAARYRPLRTELVTRPLGEYSKALGLVQSSHRPAGQ